MAEETKVRKSLPHSVSSPYLPSGQGVLVSFRNLTYAVKDRNKKGTFKKLIDGVSGYLRPSELCMLMGPSGCGKTTLLDILSSRKEVGSLEGEVKFGGIKPTPMFLRRYTGYVEQFDTLVPILTTEEMLRYTAELKLEMHVSSSDKQAAVDDVIQKLGLESCRKVLIGSNLARGISGGQAKRVNIGIALISNPRVLFLDEPTTGLDSFTSNEVISVIKSLSSTGITVCATIHSPSEYAFSSFDRMLLLLRGKTVFFGKCSETMAYLKNACSSFESSLDLHVASEAEWITDVIMMADRAGHFDSLVDCYKNSEAHDHAMGELEEQMQQTTQVSDEFAKILAVKKATTTPSWYSLLILMRYRLIKNYCTGVFYGSHAAPWLIQTLIMFSTFWFVADNVSPSSVTNVTGIIFFWCVTPAFGAAAYIPSIMLARPLYFRERNDGLYRSVTFLMYLLLEEFFIAVPVTLIINVIMWFGMKLAGNFVLWWISFFITYIAGITVSYAICSVSPSIDVANAAVPIFGVICLFFSGYLIRADSIGWWWRWMLYLTPTYYGFGAQMNNFFSGERNFPFLGSPSVTSYFDKINPLKLALFAVATSKEMADPYDGQAFLQSVLDSIKLHKAKQGESHVDGVADEACLYLEMQIAQYYLISENMAECKQLMDRGSRLLDSMSEVNHKVAAAVYYVTMQYHKAKSDYAAYYKAALMYLAYASSEGLSREFAEAVAVDVSLAALLGEDVYSFGELLVHPIMENLRSSGSFGWLYDLLECFHQGDIERYDTLCTVHASVLNGQPALVANERKLREKITVLCLVSYVSSLPADEKSVSLADIGARTKLPIESVEFLLMKALSLRLIEGIIDQVNGTVSISWIAPRVLTMPEIEDMKDRLNLWLERVEKKSADVEVQSIGIV
eukprot:jgi/Picre1/35145/NNA_002607.t1